ncbi:MAG: hypothetical protein PHC43_01115 [Candidatus Marinimicrobia bacterium]|nr:hypothetical protein [Candidatus Neomarinimicrobiota bacterium]
MSNNQNLAVLNHQKTETLQEFDIVKADLKRKKDKVIILGYCPYTLMDVPWDNPDFEFWGMNDLYTQIPKADRWFEIHVRELVEKTSRSQNHLKWLRDVKLPIYMQEHYDDIPWSVKYPLEEIKKEYPYGDYLNNSCSYMVALAIKMGFKEIRIYGIDMASDMLLDREYGYQRPSCEYWLGIAAGKGIKIMIPPKADMLKLRYQYGYVEENEAKVKIEARLKDFKLKIAQGEQQKRDLMEQFYDMVIKAEDTQPEQAQAKIKEIKNQLKNIRMQISNIDNGIAKFQGASEDAEYVVRVWTFADELKLFGRGSLYDEKKLFGGNQT